MRYSSVDTTTGRRVIRSTDGRSIVPVLVLEISAAAKLATCVRMDGTGTGRPFVVEARQFLEGAADVWSGLTSRRSSARSRPSTRPIPKVNPRIPPHAGSTLPLIGAVESIAQ